MDEKYIEYLEFVLEGELDSEPVSLDNFNYKILKDYFFDKIDDLISKNTNINFKDMKQSLSSGSVKSRFSRIGVSESEKIDKMYNAIIQKNYSDSELYNLEALYSIQSIIKENPPYKFSSNVFFSDGTSKSFEVTKDTNYERKKDTFVDITTYLYGEIVDIGGVKEPNVHICINDDSGTKYIVKADRDELSSGDNRLYKTYGLHVKGKQAISGGKLMDLELISFMNYSPELDKPDIYKKIEKQVQEAWRDVENISDWVEETRGNK